MNVPFYNSVREYTSHKSEFDAAIHRVMARGDFILGQEVSEFEKECAAFLGTRYAVGVASGSDALLLGADILEWRNGAEVITPTFTFFASTSCVVRLGGKPVFVDMDEQTLNMDMADAACKITGKTAGILPVHLFLQTTPMQQVLDLARDANIPVLEDAAEAWGMESFVDGTWRKAGTMGSMGAFSFFPTKTLGAYGDAGLLVTDNDELHQKIKSFRVHGATVKYQHQYIGYNSRLDTLQAAILRVKLKSTVNSMAARANHAKHYSERLTGIPGVRIPEVHVDSKPVYYVFNILVPRRDCLVERFREKGIGYSIYYPKPLHLQACFEYLGHKDGDFPVAERICGEIIALPMYPELKADEIDYICDTVSEFYRS
jgi:dTDP-4-amino-4,6-dideoxygalactose transaminase